MNQETNTICARRESNPGDKELLINEGIDLTCSYKDLEADAQNLLEALGVAQTTENATILNTYIFKKYCEYTEEETER